jgi:hypothetical protein
MALFFRRRIHSSKPVIHRLYFTVYRSKPVVPSSPAVLLRKMTHVK